MLVVALLRLFQPDLPYLAVDNDQVGLQIQWLRRLIPSSLMSELRPHALEIHGASFDHRALHRALETAAHRAGLVAAGGAAAPISLLLARVGAPISPPASGIPRSPRSRSSRSAKTSLPWPRSAKRKEVEGFSQTLPHIRGAPTRNGPERSSDLAQ